MSRADQGPKPRTPLPYQLAPIDNADIFAVQAIANGIGGQAEQLRFWAFLQKFCGCGRMSYWPGGEDGRRNTDFAEGKRFVGDQLRRIANLKPKEIDSRGEPPPMPGAATAANQSTSEVNE